MNALDWLDTYTEVNGEINAADEFDFEETAKYPVVDKISEDDVVSMFIVEVVGPLEDAVKEGENVSELNEELDEL